jgi:hypothetical protein
MSTDYLLSTLALLEHLGRCDLPPYAGALEERHLLWRACTSIQGVDDALADLLHSAMRDHVGHHLGRTMARLLLKARQLDDADLAFLCPWDAIAIRWRQAGLSAAAIAELVRAAGLGDDRFPDIGRLEGILVAPREETFEAADIIHALFGDRIGAVNLRDDGFWPPHDELLADLARMAASAIVLDELAQAGESGETGEMLEEVQGPTTLTMQLGDGRTAQFTAASGIYAPRKEAFWLIRYMHAGRARAFRARAQGTWMDAEAVFDHFNVLSTEIGHPQRAYRFDNGLDGSDEWALFVVADAIAFPVLVDALSLPLCFDGGQALRDG